MQVFIKGNVPSSKNSKRWTGKMLINSKTVMRYYKAVEQQMKNNADKFRKEIDKKNAGVQITIK